MKKRKTALPFLVLFLAFLFPENASAKAFGAECEDVVTGGGTSCVVTRTVCKKYFLFIKYDTEISSIDIDCSGAESEV